MKIAPEPPKAFTEAFLRPFLDLPPDTALLLALLDLKTERLLAEVEPIIIRNACIEATYAAIEDQNDVS